MKVENLYHQAHRLHERIAILHAQEHDSNKTARYAVTLIKANIRLQRRQEKTRLHYLEMEAKARRTWSIFFDKSDSIDPANRIHGVTNALYFRYMRRHEQLLSWAKHAGIWNYK